MGLQMPCSAFCKFSGVLVTSLLIVTVLNLIAPLLITFINYNPWESPETHN